MLLLGLFGVCVSARVLVVVFEAEQERTNLRHWHSFNNQTAKNLMRSREGLK